MTISNTAYLQQLYQNLLGRVLDPGGSSYFLPLLQSGYYTRAQVAGILMVSTEFAATPFAPLVRLYGAAFNRIVDADGWAFWSSIHQQGGSFAQIAQQFVDSNEFAALYGAAPSDDALVNTLYQNVLKRSADTAGLAFWTGALKQGISRGQVLNDMAQSAENAARMAYNVSTLAAYWGIADRMPTQVEVSAASKDLPTMLSAVVTLANSVIPVMSFGSTLFAESLLNDGSISNTINVTLTGDEFTGLVGAVLLAKFSGVPSGLTAVLTKTDATTASLSLTGVAKAHGSANDVANLTLTLTDKELLSGTYASMQGTTTKMRVSFIDLIAVESGGLLTASGAVASAVSINLVTNQLTLGGKVVPLQSGSITNAVGADASGLSGSKVAVSFTGDNAANSYFASPLGDSVNGGGGADMLTGGAGVDRYVFAATPAANGLDTIGGFAIGKSGDVLDLHAFLNKTGITNIATRLIGSTAAVGSALVNGDIMVVAGAVASAADVVPLFGGAATLPAPTLAGKYVVITADIIGDSQVWEVINQTDITAITESEVTQVATLVGVHNLQLVGFESSNFA